MPAAAGAIPDVVNAPPLKLPKPTLYLRALRDYAAAVRVAATSWLGRKPRRNEQLVSSVYERHWQLDNYAYVEERDRRRDLFWVNRRLIQADGWYVVRSYLDLFTGVVDRLKVRSALEVGAGRGKNLALLALRRPELELAGLELTREGVARGRELAGDLPPRFLDVAGAERLDDARRRALERIDFRQGSALQMPFADKSFDFSFTCLVLEQLPRDYPRVLREMTRVTRGHCAFLEAFHEANGPLGRAYLRGMDYFRARYREFRKFGLEPISFSTAMPQKVRFRTGLLVARVL